MAADGQEPGGPFDDDSLPLALLGDEALLGLGGDSPATPHVIVLFGATGDLARRKLLPGLFHLSRAGMLPDCHIVATSLEALDEGEYHGIARTACDEFARGLVTDEHWDAFVGRISYVPGHHGVHGLAETVRTLEATFDAEPRRLHYLSIPPHAADSVVRTLGEAGLTDRARVIMEKPFGTDLHSARRLNSLVREVFDDDQVFRIDHFLGKEAAVAGKMLYGLRFSKSFVVSGFCGSVASGFQAWAFAGAAGFTPKSQT